jgi:hypothetical protein
VVTWVKGVLSFLCPKIWINICAWIVRFLL